MSGLLERLAEEAEAETARSTREVIANTLPGLQAGLEDLRAQLVDLEGKPADQGEDLPFGSQSQLHEVPRPPSRAHRVVGVVALANFLHGDDVLVLRLRHVVSDLSGHGDSRSSVAGPTEGTGAAGPLAALPRLYRAAWWRLRPRVGTPGGHPSIPDSGAAAEKLYESGDLENPQTRTPAQGSGAV